MITTSSSCAISGTRRCTRREGRATIRKGNPAAGWTRGSIAARSDHSRALPDGSASTRSTCRPASTKMCASHTADVVLPVPGLRLSKATLRAGIPRLLQLNAAMPRAGMHAVLQYPRHYGSHGVHGGSVRAPEPGARGGAALSTACGRNGQIAVARGSIMRTPCGKRRLCRAQPRCARQSTGNDVVSRLPRIPARRRYPDWQAPAGPPQSARTGWPGLPTKRTGRRRCRARSAA